jgi:hypothetical protein
MYRDSITFTAVYEGITD